MSGAGRWLLDTNILLRIAKEDDPGYFEIHEARRFLSLSGARLCFTSQTLGEFWNAATRPLKQNGFGMNVQEADLIASTFEREFCFLPDSPEVHHQWRRLLVEYEVSGVQVHDTRLAASMYVHGGRNVLTFNTRDFSGFTELRACSPMEVLKGI